MANNWKTTTYYLPKSLENNIILNAGGDYLYAMTEEILKRMGIASLNEMQEEVLKISEKEKDLIILSPTGSGKTLAFLLPLLKNLKNDIEETQALILVPSRELAIQIEQVFKSMSTGFKVNSSYGGHSTRTEINNLSEAPTVLIGTPGRISYHIERRNFDPTKVHTVVLDEFDKCLEFGFQEDMSFIIRNLKNLKRRFLTSATNLKDIPQFTGILKPVTIDFLKDAETISLQLKAVRSTGTDKLHALFSLVCLLGNSSTLVFCNHRDAVERISALLHEKGLGHDIFHGALEQDEREKAIIKFRNGTHHLLITTDLASRGLDIPEIENVIHYQLAPAENAFIHRNGRTARMKANGTAYLVLSQEEEIPEYIAEKPEFITLPSKNVVPPKTEWITLYISAGKKDKINKMDLVGFFLQKGELAKEDLGKIEVLDRSSYIAVKRGKVNSLLQLIKNEKIKKKSVKIEIAK